MSTPIPTYSVSHDKLLAMQTDAAKTSLAVRTQLGSLQGKAALWLSSKGEAMPSPVAQHLAATRLLNQAVAFQQSSGKAPVPPSVLKTLDESLKLVQLLAAKIDHSKLPNSPFDLGGRYIGENRLLLSDSTQNNARLPETHAEWYLNLGLLMNVYQRSQDPLFKQEVAFLAIQYLAKVAPYCFDELCLPAPIQRELNLRFQHGLIEPGISYNREYPVFDPFLLPGILSQTAPASGNLTFVIGKQEIGEFLPLWFSMIDSDQEFEEWATAHLTSAAADNFAQYIEPPPLFDLTSSLGPFLFSSDMEPNDALFAEKLAQFREQLERAIGRAATAFLEKQPKTSQTSENRERIIVFLRSNCIAICRGNTKFAGFLKILPLYEDPKFFTLPEGVWILDKFVPKRKNGARHICESNFTRAKLRFVDFINGTGIRMTSIEGKRALLEAMPLKKLLEANHHGMAFYAPQGPNCIYYPCPTLITETRVFKKLEARLSDPALISRYPYLQVLGLSIIQLVKGLAEEIKGMKWTSLNADPDRRQVLQNSLFRIVQHVTVAENQLHDFGKFTQAIELIHYEISMLLTLCSPFTHEDFSAIYLRQLTFIPRGLQKFVKAGLTKSSMNTFSGINVALRKMKPHPYRVYQPGVHFEIARSMEREDALGDALTSPPDAVDLYVCEFNHNVNLDPAHNEYQATHVIREVRSLLKHKPKTQHLTVAVDCTIDFLHSKKVRALLKYFEKEIEGGRLNFVFFRSGQKFDMLGMDHFYGSPFYMVNNGDACWRSFDNLTTDGVHRTDLLSAQWFCLLNRHAPDAADAHRRLIFENTAKIRQEIPEHLKPGNPSPVKVCTIQNGVETCFIDIKISGPQAEEISDRLINDLYRRFAEANKRIQTRAGYGYVNPNVCYFPFQDHQGGTLRINPGLDFEETRMLIGMIEEIIPEGIPKNLEKNP